MTGMKYEPDPDCEWCDGTGESRRRSGDVLPCICTYVDHAVAGMVQGWMNRQAQEFREGKL